MKKKGKILYSKSITTFVIITFVINLYQSKIIYAEETSNLNISGLAYNAYYYDFSKGSQDKNGFDLTRLYLTYKENITEDIGMRITTDIGRVSNDQEKQYYRLFLKYAYLELKKPSWRVNLLLGLHYVPLLAFQENIWGYRSIGKMLTDLEHKQTSSDLGLKIHGQFPKDYGDYAFSFVNGEGYNQAELGKHKGLYGRITLRPFPNHISGLRLTGFASQIQHDSDSSTTLITLFTSYESKHLTAGAEISTGFEKNNSQITDYQGYSFFNNFKINTKWTLISRVDLFNPDRKVNSNAHFREILGIGYWIKNNVEIVIDYQGVQYKKESINKNSNILFTHLHFVF